MVYFYLFFSLFLLVDFFTYGTATVKPQINKPIPLLIVAIGNEEIHLIAKIIAQDCSFTKQCETKIKKIISLPTVETIKSWAAHYPLALLINSHSTQKAVEWRLYNCFTGQLIVGKRYIKNKFPVSVCAHAISNQLWPQLTGQLPLFTSRIVYCKEVNVDEKTTKKQICIADITGENEQVIVNSTKLNTAPRFNHDKYHPLIFFSQHTEKNLRLMVIDKEKKQRIASNFDGINMLPSFNQKGDALVYCASRGDGTCHLYYYKRGLFKCLTKNEGRNISPTFADDSTLYFCSDFETGNPQIFKCDIFKGNFEKITNGGYCSSPRFSQVSQKLVYSKMFQGTMQLMLFDPVTNTHEQLTTDIGNKEEASWSPCGNYLIYSFEHKQCKRLALFNCVTRVKRFITSADKQCSFPDWSPNYYSYPIFS